MNIQKIGPFKIDPVGIKSVLRHAALSGLAVIVIAIFSKLNHYDFSGDQALALIIMSTAFKYAQKFFGTYNVILPELSTLE